MNEGILTAMSKLTISELEMVTRTDKIREVLIPLLRGSGQITLKEVKLLFDYKEKNKDLFLNYVQLAKFFYKLGLRHGTPSVE